MVFDATGLAKPEYQRQMKSLGKGFAIGVTPCGRARHTIRTRAEHCAQCNTATIAFMKRVMDNGYVYVAGSIRKQLIKLGVTSNVLERQKSLNGTAYRGVDDWKILYWVRTPTAGQVEFDAQSTLEAYAAQTTYRREMRSVDCLETFSCGYTRAIEAITKFTHDGCQTWKYANIRLYDFGEMEGKRCKRKGGFLSNC